MDLQVHLHLQAQHCTVFHMPKYLHVWYTQKGRKTIGVASSGNSDNKSGLIPDVFIDVYYCNQLIQHCRRLGLSVSWRSATMSAAVI